MPFTPFHFGPGLLFGLLLLSYIDFPTFLLANVIVDIEPILVLSLKLNYPLHGILHSFLGGTIFSFLLAMVMNRMRNILSPLMSYFKLDQTPSLKSILSASFSGIYLHIILDSFLYSDIRPYYPFDFNPLLQYDMFGFMVYGFCILSFIGAVAIYAIKLVYRRKSLNSSA